MVTSKGGSGKDGSLPCRADMWFGCCNLKHTYTSTPLGVELNLFTVNRCILSIWFPETHLIRDKQKPALELFAGPQTRKKSSAGIAVRWELGGGSILLNAIT